MLFNPPKVDFPARVNNDARRAALGLRRRRSTSDVRLHGEACGRRGAGHGDPRRGPRLRVHGRVRTSPASWRLTDANGVEYGAGGFDFPAYWRGADVAAAVDVPDGVDDLALAVTDEFGRTRRVRVARR